MSTDQPHEQQPLALMCGIEPHDGVIVAYLPKMDAMLQEVSTTYGTLLVMDGKAIDLKPAGKWWKVRHALAEANREQWPAISCLVEPIWHGSAQDFKLQAVLDKQLPAPEGHKLHMRAFSKGPWICLEPEKVEESKE